MRAYVINTLFNNFFVFGAYFKKRLYIRGIFTIIEGQFCH